MASPYDALKQEVLDAQKARDGLMRWKLLLVSGIGSAALGFSKTPVVPHAELALCLIPLACLYIDLLCPNLSIRTKLISAFLADEKPSEQPEPTARFEAFYQRFTERREKSLESYALENSARLLSASVALVGFVRPFWNSGGFIWGVLTSLMLISVGASGWYLSEWLDEKYDEQKCAIPGQADGRIRQRAYQIWENERHPEGRHTEHWAAARQEIEDERNQRLRGHFRQSLRRAAREAREHARSVGTAAIGHHHGD